MTSCSPVNRKAFPVILVLAVPSFLVFAYYTQYSFQYSPHSLYELFWNLTAYEDKPRIDELKNGTDLVARPETAFSPDVVNPLSSMQINSSLVVHEKTTFAERVSNFTTRTLYPALSQLTTHLQATSATTSMTFNTSLVVQCRESPFVECNPPSPSVKLHGDKIFRLVYYRKPSWLGGEVLNLKSCPVNQCRFESSIKFETDAVLLNGVKLRDNFLPRSRWKHQLYVLAVWEPPTYAQSSFLWDNKSVWNQHINLTMTYRTDSDIFIPYSWLKFRPLPLEDRPNYVDIAKNKTRTAVWIVSHCKTYSKRENYVTEMQKYVDVDIYGRCGQPCSKHSSSCSQPWLQYKFIIAFENSFCTDYVTEKFFTFFSPGSHIIPVVRGGAAYHKYFPNETYIDASDFKSARDLALHLKNLASDLTTYSKFLEHKDLYTKMGGFQHIGCKLCEFLHTHKLSGSKTYNLPTFLNTGHCKAPSDI